MSRKNKKKGKDIKMAEEEVKTTDEEIVEEKKDEVEEAVDDTISEMDALKAKVEDLEGTIAKMKDDEIRRIADTENYKKRLRADKENAVKYANEALISDLLEPLDNFSRALEAAETTDDTEALKKGVVMVKDHLLQVLKQNWGLEMIESRPGTPYDANTMEAYGVQEKDGIDKEEVLTECSKGWLLHGKVLRTAKVFVAKPKK